MKWLTIKGQTKDIPTTPYLIDWNGKQGSKFSKSIIDWLYPYWKHDVVLAEYPVADNKRMHYDFLNLTQRIIMEHDGKFHNQYTEFFSGSRAGYLAQIKRDILKDEAARVNNYKMIRINPDNLPLTKEWFKKTYDYDL